VTGFSNARLDHGVAKRFADNLRVERARARLSQEALAARADIHRTQISLMESAKRLPRLDTLVKLAGALDIGVEVLTAGIAYEPTIVKPGGFVVGCGDRAHG
jgi:transcriptional regulator with XRE-family HTH domain